MLRTPLLVWRKIPSITSDFLHTCITVNSHLLTYAKYAPTSVFFDSVATISLKSILSRTDWLFLGRSAIARLLTYAKFVVQAFFVGFYGMRRQDWLI